jgi:hypothetical protein
MSHRVGQAIVKSESNADTEQAIARQDLRVRDAPCTPPARKHPSGPSGDGSASGEWCCHRLAARAYSQALGSVGTCARASRGPSLPKGSTRAGAVLFSG